MRNFALLVCVVLACGTLSANAQSPLRPWLANAKPTVLEWVILELQANESDPEFGENELTVAFHGGPKSAQEGVIYCQIRYLPTANAEAVRLVERGIQERFESMRKLYSWARLEISTEVARAASKR